MGTETKYLNMYPRITKKKYNTAELLCLFNILLFKCHLMNFFNHTSVEPMVINNFFCGKLFVDPSGFNDAFDFCQQLNYKKEVNKIKTCIIQILHPFEYVTYN